LEYLGEITVAPVTSTIRDIPSEVFLSKADGMPRDCAVNCDHLQTVSKGKIGTLITLLSPGKLADVGRAIRFALDI
jgi:mRNA interferase MazF